MTCALDIMKHYGIVKSKVSHWEQWTSEPEHEPTLVNTFELLALNVYKSFALFPSK